MSNLKTKIKSLNNNYDQSNNLNEFSTVYNSQNNIHNLSSKSKNSKMILLEKISPFYFPSYIKFIKKIKNDSKSLDNIINSNISGGLKKLSFISSYNKTRNNLYNEKSQNKNRMSYNTFDSNSINNNNEINNLIIALQTPKNRNRQNINMRNNKFISISRSISTKKENSKKEKSSENYNEIQVEENNNNDSNADFNKLKTNKHKIRYLLSKNYRGKKLIIKKSRTKPQFSVISEINKRIGKKLKDNLKINKDENNINKSKNKEIKKFNYMDNTHQNISNIYINSNQKSSEINNNANNQKYNIIKEEVSLNRENNINNIFLNNKNYNNKIEINLNDLILMNEKLNDIIIKLNKANNIKDMQTINESVQFFSFYFNSSLQNKFPLFFNIEKRIIIKSAFNLYLFMFLMIYHLSLNPSILIKVIILLRKIFEVLKINFYLIVRKIEIYFGEEFTQNNEIFFKMFDLFLKNNSIYDLKEIEIIEIINKNCISISTDIENILNYYQTINNKYYSDFRDIYFSISKLDEQIINNYFNSSLYNKNFEDNILNQNRFIYTDNRIEFIEDDKYLDSIIESYKKNKKIPPFIKLNTKKKFTIVLNLENTIINCKVDSEGNILINLRPGLISFLNGIKPFYEIISFTKLSKEYSNSIIKEIEEKKKLFDYNLYREHCTLVGREFIKDISNIGRDIQKIIMVDYLEDNLRFNVSNGILIKPYNGESNKDDRVLFELKKLLILFLKLGYKDIRTAIKSYKKEIYDKITLGNED